jgi:hypothetical protein
MTEFLEKNKTLGSEVRLANKITLARDICLQPVNLEVFDLNEQLKLLVDAIRNANDHPLKGLPD